MIDNYISWYRLVLKVEYLEFL